MVPTAASDLLLKYQDKIFATCIRRQIKHFKHASEMLVKMHENTLKSHCKTYTTSRIKHFQHICEKYATSK
jgi:hypothetical protein